VPLRSLRKLQFVGELWVGSSRAQHAEHSELLRGQLRHALGVIERSAVGLRLRISNQPRRGHVLAAQYRLNVAADGAGISGLGYEACAPSVNA